MNTARAVTRSGKVEPFTGTVTETERGWSAWRCTPWGWVDMRAGRPDNEPPFTVLVFVYAGRRWERMFNRFYTVLGATRLANRFVWEVTEGKVQP